MKDFDLNLSSLKKFTNELNSDFANMGDKINNLGESIKELVNPSAYSNSTTFLSSSSTSRVSFFSSSSENSQNFNSYQENYIVTDNEADSCEEKLEKSYLFVEHSNSEPNGTRIKEYTEMKNLITTTYDNPAVLQSEVEEDNDEYSDYEDEDYYYRIEMNSFNTRENKIIDQNCERIIKKILESSSSIPVLKDKQNLKK